MDLHIEDFWKDSTVILCQLYSVFPRPHTLFLEDIIGPDTVDQFGLNSPRHQACIACITWLKEENFIRFNDFIRTEAVEHAVLTQKAIARLINPIDDTNAIELLREYVRDSNPLRFQPIIKGLLLANYTHCPDDFVED